MQTKHIVKWFLYFMAFLLSWCFVTYLRTSEFGVSIDTIIRTELFGAVYSLVPLSLVALFALMATGCKVKLKNFVLQMLIIAVLVMVSSEIWASSEEYMFKKKCTGTTSEIWKSRWWPNGGNDLHYLNGDFSAHE